MVIPLTYPGCSVFQDNPECYRYCTLRPATVRWGPGQIHGWSILIMIDRTISFRVGGGWRVRISKPYRVLICRVVVMLCGIPARSCTDCHAAAAFRIPNRWFNVGPPSSTATQHWASIVATSRVSMQYTFGLRCGMLISYLQNAWNPIMHLIKRWGNYKIRRSESFHFYN